MSSGVAGVSGLRVEVAESVEGVARHAGGWQALAEAVGQPQSLPGWLLAWWEHLAPAGAALRSVLVFDGARLVAVAPYFAQRRRWGRVDYRPLAARFAQPIGPLAAPELRARVAPLIAAALAGADPRPSLVAFDGVDAASDWPDALRRAWPGRLAPRRYVVLNEPAPVLSLDAPDYDAWFAQRSASFRQEMRKKRRRLERDGGGVRLAAPEDAPRAIAAFTRLHHQRFAQRGGSHLPRQRLQPMLQAAAHALAPSGHLRLFTVELDDEIIGVQLALAAGGVISAWSVAFDPAHARLSPGMLAVLAMLEDAHTRHERSIHLGWGASDYKLRLAHDTGNAAILFAGLLPITPRYPLTHLQLLPGLLEGPARQIVERWPAQRQLALKRLLRRARRRRG